MGSDFFIGPAVVVDDKIEEPDLGMRSVLTQIEQRSMPIVKKTELPPEGEIDNWRGFSLIVLDWDLRPVALDIPGLSVPTELSEENTAEVCNFVEKLLKKLYCPIFILTNQSVDAVKDELATRLKAVKRQLEARVMVMSKTQVGDHLFDVLTTWIESHPAVYVMELWEQGYLEARGEMFRDFELTSGQWPAILWATSKVDGVNPSFELAETITRNIVHRFRPLAFDDSILAIEQDEDDLGMSTLRKVVHRGAVVPAESLHEDVVMPGDLFAAGESEDRAAKILINVTPACDLVPRGEQTLDEVRMFLLQGDLLPDEEFASKTKVGNLQKASRAEMELEWVLREDARPYMIKFKQWSIGNWGAFKEARIGRLLDPWLTELLQRFYLHFQRQGLPRLPDPFYDANRPQ
jgi:hypothetical protein